MGTMVLGWGISPTLYMDVGAPFSLPREGRKHRSYVCAEVQNQLAM